MQHSEQQVATKTNEAATLDQPLNQTQRWTATMGTMHSKARVFSLLDGNFKLVVCEPTTVRKVGESRKRRFKLTPMIYRKIQNCHQLDFVICRDAFVCLNSLRRIFENILENIKLI